VSANGPHQRQWRPRTFCQQQAPILTRRVCAPASTSCRPMQGDELESHYLRCAPLPAYDKITRSSLGDTRPRGAEQRGSGAPEVARERRGRAAPVCILSNNNLSFTLPWSTAWTLRPESRRNFQLLWDLDYASGQREPSGGGNRTVRAIGTAYTETEPTRGRTKEQTGVGARYSGHKRATYPWHGGTPWPATLTGGFEPQ